MNILVTGGTGALGKPLVRILRGNGHRVVVLSRRPGEGADWRTGDLATGVGLAEAVTGMEAVIHAGSATTNLTRAEAIDVEGTRRLLEVAAEAGVGHLVYVSIVGMEGIPYPYYGAKLKTERRVKDGPIPWTILRATQFHNLMEVFLTPLSKLPGLLTLPRGWQFQPCATDDVAARLATVVTEAPAGLLPDFGGPEVLRFDDIALAWTRARGQKRRIVHVPIPMAFSRDFAAGKLLAPAHRDGTITFSQYLEKRYPQERSGAGRET